jgi:tetratricopeptide (TPR) repeat protein
LTNGGAASHRTRHKYVRGVDGTRENPVNASTVDVDLKLMLASSRLGTDPAAAARAASEILEVCPGHAAASLLLAGASLSLGDTAKACEVLEFLTLAQSSSAIVQLELGRAYRAAGKGEQGLAALRRAAELEPNLAETWREMSLELAATGDSHGADMAYARYTAVKPDTPGLLEPAAALSEDRVAAAEELLRQHLKSAPTDVVAMRMLATAVGRREGYAEAEDLLREALRLEPGDAAVRYDLAQLLLTQQKPTQIPPLVERLLLLDPHNADYRNLQASFLSFISQHGRSIDILASLVAESPGRAAAWINYGHELKAAGRRREGIDAYRRAIALAPTSGAAYWSLANLKTFRFETSDVDAMRTALLRSDVRHDDRVTLEFALAKALEDDAQYAESFEHYSNGNSLRRSVLPYDPAKRRRHLQRSKEILTREFFAARADWGSTRTDPIFVVGLPRSGSTLLEQILASHSNVQGTRELGEITATARELGGARGNLDPFLYLESLESLDAQRVAALAQAYLDDTRVYRSGSCSRFVDKMPNNFQHIALIQLMFPRASIIDARRHPLACCFSCFKQYFGMGQIYTYDLAQLGSYYRDYVELMAHFDAVLPGRIHRVRYEDVVTDLEGEVRKLLEHCGLSFEVQCLRFYENRRVVQTASSEQVRRPIFSEGVDQWRHFEPWLGPLKDALGDAIDR